MARPKKSETLSTISVRLPPKMIEGVDECAKKLQEETPLLEVTRTETIRYLIHTGMDDFWKQRKKKKR